MKIHFRLGDFEVSTIALIILVLAFFGFWYVSVYDRPITNQYSENKNIIVFGDSLALGTGSKNSEGFISALEQELGIDIKNLGVAGDTTADAWSRIDEVTDLDPRVVIISLGGNDFLQGVSQADVESRYKRIISILHEHGSAVVILEVPGYKTLYRSLSREYQTGYVSNILNGLLTQPGHMFDSVHPNDKGYEKIAHKIKPVLAHLVASQ